MKEPTKYSMESGLPVDPNSEVKKYPMNEEVGTEQTFLNFIQKAKESRQKYNERLERIAKENKDKDKDGFYE